MTAVLLWAIVIALIPAATVPWWAPRLLNWLYREADRLEREIAEFRKTKDQSHQEER